MEIKNANVGQIVINRKERYIRLELIWEGQSYGYYIDWDDEYTPYKWYLSHGEFQTGKCPICGNPQEEYCEPFSKEALAGLQEKLIQKNLKLFYLLNK